MFKNLVKIPVDYIKTAIRAAAQSKKDMAEIDAERAEKYPNMNEAKVREYAGESGVQQYQADIADYNARKAAIAEKAKKEIKGLWEQAQAFITDECTPKGEQVANEPDFALLDHDILTEEQLERMMQKHSDNRAFLQAAARYAVRQGWPNADKYALIDKENSVREYTDQIFSRLETAAEQPAGPAFMQYVTMPSEYSRIAQAYGLTEELAASGGEKLFETVKDLF